MWTQRAKEDLGQWQEAVQEGQRKYFYNSLTREASHFHPNSTAGPLEALKALKGL